MVGKRRVGREDEPETGLGDGDGDPGQKGISLAHVGVDHQNVVVAAAAAVVIAEMVDIPEAEKRVEEVGLREVKGSIEKK